MFWLTILLGPLSWHLSNWLCLKGHKTYKAPSLNPTYWVSAFLLSCHLTPESSEIHRFVFLLCVQLPSHRTACPLALQELLLLLGIPSSLGTQVILEIFQAHISSTYLTSTTQSVRYFPGTCNDLAHCKETQMQQIAVIVCCPAAQWSEHPHMMKDVCISFLLSLVDCLLQSLCFMCGFDSLGYGYSMWCGTTHNLGYQK